MTISGCSQDIFYSNIKDIEVDGLLVKVYILFIGTLIGVQIMSRKCELTGKAVMSGNNVSHANNKNRRKFLPNLHQVTLRSNLLDEKVYLRISSKALRSVEHRGGLDQFLMKEAKENLSSKAQTIKKRIEKLANGTQN